MANFHLDESWPHIVDEIEITPIVEAGMLVSIAFAWVLLADDQAPSLRPLREGQTGFREVDYKLNRLNEVEHLARTMRGLLSLDGIVEFKFELKKLEWIADSPEEELGIKIIIEGQSSEPDPFKPERLPFTQFARAVTSAPSSQHLEVALSFLRRGRRDIKEGRFIEAIYNNFFFLETLFAPGFSNPKKVKAKFLESQDVVNAIELNRHQPIERPSGFLCPSELKIWQDRFAYFKKSDEDIISNLVKLRGDLHHHAPGSPNTWHPDMGHSHQVESLVLHDIAVATARFVTKPIMSQPALAESEYLSAEMAGAIISLNFMVHDCNAPEDAEPKVVTLQGAGQIIDRTFVENAHLKFRTWIAENSAHMQVRKYTINHPERDREYGPYGFYERLSFPNDIIRSQ